MKKMMMLALGLSLFTGSTVFAAERPVRDSRDRGRNEARNDKRRQDDRKDRRAPQRDQHVDRRGRR